MTNIRASIMLPAALHQRLRMVSRQEDKPLSQVVREILDRELARREHERLDGMYRALKALDGAGGAGITDASTTIDEVLYGENGAWKGRGE